MQENLSRLLPEIYDHMANEAPREGCGLIINEDEPKFIPLENISGEKDHFTIDPKEFVKYSMISKILYVVHSHYNSNCNPSEHDINTCNALQIPYLIVSYPNKDYKVVQPC